VVAVKVLLERSTLDSSIPIGGESTR
jgi:hypothetical protein